MTKVRAEILRPDRRPVIVNLKNRDVRGKSFRHGDCTYFLHPDRFMLKDIWRFGRKTTYTVFYYTQGVAQPLPVPDFGGRDDPVLDEAGNVQYGADGKPLTRRVFPKIVDNGVPSEELAQVFNPWFYRIIAHPTDKVKNEIQFWLTVGISIAVVYIIWMMNTQTEMLSALKDHMMPPPPPAPPAGGP